MQQGGTCNCAGGQIYGWLDGKDCWLDGRDGWLDGRDGWQDGKDGWLDGRSWLARW